MRQQMYTGELIRKKVTRERKKPRRTHAIKLRGAHPTYLPCGVPDVRAFFLVTANVDPTVFFTKHKRRGSSQCWQVGSRPPRRRPTQVHPRCRSGRLRGVHFSVCRRVATRCASRSPHTCPYATQHAPVEQQAAKAPSHADEPHICKRQNPAIGARTFRLPQ